MKKESRLPFNGGVALCRKQSDGGRVTVWIEEAPELKAQARSLQAAEAALVNLLWERFDLDEPVAFQYRDESAETDAIVVIGVNETTDCSDPGRYFEGGFCPTCQSGRGKRNKELIQLERLPRRPVSGFFLVFQPYLKCGRCVTMNLLHASLCRELEKVSGSSFEFREILVKGKSSTGYLEVIPNSVIQQVVPKTQKGIGGGKCSQCGIVIINFKGGYASICKTDADMVRERKVAAINSFSRPRCVVTSALFKSLQKIPEGKGLLALPITEFPEDQITLRPRLEKIVPFRL